MTVCPVCKEKLAKCENAYKCENNHSFDIAKEGYINLLTGKHKNGSLIGDNKDMAKARRAFLEEGHYAFLADKLSELISSKQKNAECLDISCGEGWYSGYIKEKTGCNMYGFDISKEMVRLAAKKYKNVDFFVANISNIPVADNSIDAAVHICAPFNEKEFARILKEDGVLYSVVPGKYHLKELKALVYDTPYDNNEDVTDYGSLTLIDKITVDSSMTVNGNENIMSLFKMTPYYYKTSPEDKAKLCGVDRLTTTAEFTIRLFNTAPSR